MKLYALFALAISAGTWSGASVAVSALECSGCTAKQEEDKVRNRPSGNGYFFVYNLPQARVRKFLTYLTADDGLRSAEGENLRGIDGIEIARFATTPDGDAGERPKEGSKAAGWVRVLEEYPVDPGVQEIFNTMVQVERESPGMIRGEQRTRVPIGNVGQYPSDQGLGPRDYDPRLIAWDSAGQGEFNRFIERMSEKLESRESANSLHPSLGKVLFGVHGKSKSVTVSFGSGGYGVGVSWERVGSSVKIKVCDSKENCVWLTLGSDGNGNISLVFEKVVDDTETPLPAESSAPRVRWSQAGGQSAAEYAAWLKRLYMGNTLNVIGGPQGCRTHILSCTEITGTTLLACQLHCQ